MTYEVRPMSFPEDQFKMDEFVFTTFLPDMPLMHVFNIDTDPGLPHRLPSPHQRSPHSVDVYLKAVDHQGEMVAIAVSKEHVEFKTDSNTPREWLQMVEFLKFIEEDSHITKLPGKAIELLVVAVHKDWRQHGLARRLAEESMEVARARGFTSMTVCCANEYTARLARSMGWRELYRLAYKDYPRLAGVDVTLNTTPPHEYMYLYVTEL